MCGPLTRRFCRKGIKDSLRDKTPFGPGPLLTASVRHPSEVRAPRHRLKTHR